MLPLLMACAAAAGVTRRHYIAAELVEWNYLPLGMDGMAAGNSMAGGMGGMAGMAMPTSMGGGMGQMGGGMGVRDCKSCIAHRRLLHRIVV